MSKAVKTDHEFKIDIYADLLSRAQGGRSQTEFAKDCGLSVAYICKHLNKRINTPPTPSTLKKIAAVAANGVTYGELLDASGYDSSKYTLQTPNTNESISRFDSLQFDKLAVATITGALSRSNLKWSLNGAPEQLIKNYDLDIELSNNKLTHWYFTFLTVAPSTTVSDNTAFLNRMYAYYGRLAMISTGITSKHSFVTDSATIYDLLKEKKPTALAMYVSIILIDTVTLSIIKEEYLKTAFSDNREDIFSFT